MSCRAGSTPALLFDHRAAPNNHSSESAAPSTDSTEKTEKTVGANPYRHILTHQEKKKQRMPKRKADAWPASILTDPDVLSLDDEGRFVLCKVCHVHYAVHGGKKPKPVIMNSGFRTRAWEVHKERTNSHRLHKKQDAQHAARANAQQRRADEERKKSGDDKPVESKAGSMAAAAAAAALAPPPVPRPPVAKSHVEPVARGFPPAPSGAPMVPKPLPQGGESQKQQTASPRRRMARSPLQEPPQRPWATQAELHEHSRRPMAHERAPPPPSIPPPISGRNTPQPPMSSEQADGLMRWRNMHDDVTRALGSSLSHKRPAPDAYDEGDVTSPSMRLGDTEDFSGNNERVAKKLKSLDDEYDAKVMKRQEAYFDRRSDMYKQYWGTLRDVYNSANHISHGAHGHHQAHAHGNENTHARASHTHNMNGLNRASGGSYHQNQQHHRHQQDAAVAAQAKESIEECTTPDESDTTCSTGSSEPMVKPVVVHDQALINALDRLTGVISKQFSDRYTHETSLLLDAMNKLTNAVDDLRMDHGTAMNHMIQLQEQNLQVMQELLHFKLEKQRTMAAHHVGRSGSGGSGGSGSS